MTDRADNKSAAVLSLAPDAAHDTPARAGVAVIRLTGEIGAGNSFSLALVKEQIGIAALAGPVRRLHLIINSTGGTTGEGFAIYDYLRALPLPISAEIAGRCESSAVVVLLAASFRRAHAGATVLIHRATFTREQLEPASLNAADLRAFAARLDETDNRIVDLLAARTGHDRAWFAQEICTEDPMSEADALLCGIVHEVEGIPTRCGSAAARHMAALAATPRVFVPARFMTPNFLDACRVADLCAEADREDAT